MKTPNYHNFYQKALIPIGYNDLAALKETVTDELHSRFTHWLIAVEGEQLPQKKIYFHWKVSIYPADIEGDFNWRKPIFCSHAMESIDKANDLANTLVALSKQDQLSTFHLQQKIS